MARSKGTGVVFLRSLFQERDKAFEDRFVDTLTQEELKVYSTASPMKWDAVDVLTSLFKKAAHLLYPEAANPLQHFSRKEAQDHLKGIYRLLFPFVSIPFLINKTASLWNTYYDKGQARTERMPGQRKAWLVVTGFPDLPKDNRRDIVSGFVMGAIELTGAANICIELEEQDPHAWKWIVTWD